MMLSLLQSDFGKRQHRMRNGGKMLINDIFQSINGECSSQHQGSLCTFIRFAGCDLRCKWCDTKQSQTTKGSKEMSVRSVMRKVNSHKYKNVVITGGEPLVQRGELLKLIAALNLNHYNISIETNGAHEIPAIPYVSWVADWKCKSSGMSKHMSLTNIEALRGKDFLKFVIADEDDFDEALAVVKKMTATYIIKPRFAFSPTNKDKSQELISWMKKERVLKEQGAIFSLQIHKLLGVQ
jgi:7-carboxy-7-deazaguanine synthase